jgi:hypothetical protein
MVKKIKDRYPFPHLFKAMSLIFFLCYYLRLDAVIFLHGYLYTQEPLAQVHTTPEFEDWMNRLAVELDFPLDFTEGDYQKTLYASGDALWPALWHFRQRPYFSFEANEDRKRKMSYVIMDSFANTDFLKTHEIRAIPLRSYWWPNFDEMTWKKFFSFMVTRKPWSEVGVHYVYLGVKKKKNNSPYDMR